MVRYHNGLHDLPTVIERNGRDHEDTGPTDEKSLDHRDTIRRYGGTNGNTIHQGIRPPTRTTNINCERPRLQIHKRIVDRNAETNGDKTESELRFQTIDGRTNGEDESLHPGLHGLSGETRSQRLDDTVGHGGIRIQ